MSGIKDLHTLLYWLDNTRSDSMKKVLSNTRSLSSSKVELIRDLERDGFFQQRTLNSHKFEKKHLK